MTARRKSVIRRQRIILMAGICAVAVFALLGYTERGRSLYAAIAAPYPEEWLRVKPGMTSGEARAVAGKPASDGRMLKILDRWALRKNGVELHLDVFFSGREENSEESVITRVERWKRVLLPFVPNTDECADPPVPPAAAPTTN